MQESCEICRNVCKCICDICRSVPVTGIVCFIISHVGMIVAGSAQSTVSELLGNAGSGADTLERYVELISLPFVIISVVNIIALVLAFLAAGRTRECIFGAQSRKCPKLLCCLKCLFGRCTFGIVLTLTIIMFLVMLIFSYVFMMIFVLMVIFGVVCEAGKGAVDAAAGLIDAINKNPFVEVHPGRRFASDLDIAHVCNAASKSLDKVGLQLAIGTIIVAIGQAAMMAQLSADNERVAAETTHTPVAKTEIVPPPTLLGDSANPPPPLATEPPRNAHIATSSGRTE